MKDISNQPAAVEALPRGSAAISIRRIDQRQGAYHDVVPDIRVIALELGRTGVVGEHRRREAKDSSKCGIHSGGALKQRD